MYKITNQFRRVVVLAALVGCSAIGAAAATFQVTSNLDNLTETCAAAPNSCTLREAVNDANLNGGADTITFAAGITTITLTNGEILVTDAITIGSSTATALTIITVDLASGGRIFRTLATGDDLTLNRLELANGVASGNGGAILNSGAVLTVNDSYIHDNLADSGGLGGGIYTSGGTVNVNRSTIGGTTALGSNRANGGGGIYNLNGTVNLTNSTVSGNFATNGFGGGYYGFTDLGAATLNSVSTTIANNSALNGGGIAVTASLGISAANINNTLVADNTGFNSGADVFGGAGTIVSSGYNLIETTSGATIVAATGDQFNVNPALIGLLPLQNYGGLTPTHGLKINAPVSLALDKGNTNQTTDQRGSTRNADFPTVAPATNGNNTDIGAFEAQLGATAARVSVSGRVMNGGRGAARARVTMTDANGATRTAMTNFFGYFRFDDVTAGAIYIFDVSTKRQSFSPRAVTVNDEITNLNLVADF